MIEELDFGWIEFWGFCVWRLINIMNVCDDVVEDDEGHHEGKQKKKWQNLGIILGAFRMVLN